MKRLLFASLFLFCALSLFGDDDFDSEFDNSKKESISDPLMGYNRVMTSVNDFIFTNLFFPLAKGYRYVVPEEGRASVGRAFDNLAFPIRFVNNILQLKFTNALEELGRFCINSTIGFGGLFDHAESSFDLKTHNEDFGQTLGHYGVGGGFHIVLPILGPSNLRDLVGKVPDSYIDPLTYIKARGANLLANSEQGYGAKGAQMLNFTSFNIERYENIKKESLDFYIMVREIYEQHREKEIKE